MQNIGYLKPTAKESGETYRGEINTLTSRLAIIGLKGTMNAMFLKDLADKNHLTDPVTDRRREFT